MDLRIGGEGRRVIAGRGGPLPPHRSPTTPIRTHAALLPHRHIAVYAHRRCRRRRVYNNNNIIRATTTSRHGLCSARRLKAIYFHNTTCNTPLPPSPPPRCRVLSFRRNYTRPLTPPPCVHSADNASHHFSSGNIYIYTLLQHCCGPTLNRYYGCSVLVLLYTSVLCFRSWVRWAYRKKGHDFVYTMAYTYIC